MIRVLIRSLIVTFMLSWAAIASAQDYAREKRWADEVLPAVLVGEPVWLELKGGHKFLSLLAQGEPKRAAIVLVHGVGVHPDHGVIGALRMQLNDLGYTTLSIQMPVARGEGADVNDYYPGVFGQAGERIATAERYLRRKGHQRVVLVSHSMGAWMANVYLADTPAPPFAAWVSIGVTGRYWNASLISIPFLGIEWFAGKIRLPVLDVYGENDLPPVRDAARQRARALAHIANSEQVMIRAADHHYAGKEAELVKEIDRFVTRVVK